MELQDPSGDPDSVDLRNPPSRSYHSAISSASGGTIGIALGTLIYKALLANGIQSDLAAMDTAFGIIGGWVGNALQRRESFRIAEGLRIDRERRLTAKARRLRDEKEAERADLLKRIMALRQLATGLPEQTESVRMLLLAIDRRVDEAEKGLLTVSGLGKDLARLYKQYRALESNVLMPRVETTT